MKNKNYYIYKCLIYQNKVASDLQTKYKISRIKIIKLSYMSQRKIIKKILYFYKYKFFKNIDKYLPYYQFCYNNQDCDQYKSICDSVGSRLVGKTYELVNICARLHYLINKLFNSTKSQDEETHLEYLNFWLNHELHTIDDNICPDNFCQLMRERNVENSTLMKLKSRSYYINKEEVNNINSLYYLYYNYNEIKKILDETEPSQEPVERYAKHCVQKYKDLKAKCSKKNEDLCKALDVFKEKYENADIKKEKLLYWTIDSLPSLHDVEDNKTPNTAISHIENTMLSGESIPTKKIGQASEIVTLSADPVELSSGSLMTNTFEQRNFFKILERDKMPQEMKQETVNTEGALDNDTQKIVGPVIGTLGLTSIFFTFYKVNKK
ncbi:hypothetical protein PVBG_05834 [Plasmodium vivax Brazil I]|uniref:Uncharacterized protein n=1 Tax=Plasmodium vivax (strain Brazil I) TaxID=1033975 RepID=A0A0J9T0K5_PLAV1|nr:hypothetical protein PVBG_05834 [Plasmodium vivax Brazil I]